MPSALPSPARAPRPHVHVREDRPVVDLVRLELPEPPSVNALFANVSAERRARARAIGRSLPGRLKSAEYSTWLNAAGWELKGVQPRLGRVEGAYELTVECSPACAKDLGNLEKALSDLLVDHGIVSDDSAAERIVVERNPDVAAKRVRVTIRPRWRAPS